MAKVPSLQNHPIQFFIRVLAIFLCLWGLFCIVMGGHYRGDVTIQHESKDSDGNTVRTNIQVDAFFVAYGCLCFIPPLYLLYSWYCHSSASSPVCGFTILGFAIYTIVGVAGAGLFGPSLDDLPEAVMVTSKIMFGVIALPIVLMILYLLSTTIWDGAVCACWTEEQPASIGEMLEGKPIPFGTAWTGDEGRNSEAVAASVGKQEADYEDLVTHQVAIYVSPEDELNFDTADEYKFPRVDTDSMPIYSSDIESEQAGANANGSSVGAASSWV